MLLANRFIVKTISPDSTVSDTSRIAVVVFEHGGQGSKTAAPIFCEIVEKYFAPLSK